MLTYLNTNNERNLKSTFKDFSQEKFPDKAANQARFLIVPGKNEVK